MKIAIVSDLHLGYERFEEDAYLQAKSALESASGMADAVLIPGDIFDKRYPRPDVISQAINIFRELSKKEWGARIVGYTGSVGLHTHAPIIAIPGTHERIAEGKDNAVRLLSLAGLLADTSEATTTIQKGDELVSVFGLGGIAEELVKERIAAISPKPTEGTFSIFMFHQSIYEMLPYNDNFIKYSDLPKGFDIYVSGHMHSRHDAEVHGKKLLIPGSTVLTQMKGDEQGSKGFIVFDTHDGSYKFVQINSRPYVTAEIRVENAKPSELISRCESETERMISGKSTKPIIRLKVTGTMANGFDKADLQAHALAMKYSDKAFLTIDTSQLSSPGTELMIDELRDGKIDDIPIKELGMLTLYKRLKDAGADQTISYTELFNILSSQASKEKAVKSAAELLLVDGG
ncbi:MAG: metallophosphoesterase [Candidatus Marsarchaeota archaeon]|jgi:DNA repair exonuclease SbcCD nuclease subunit|nr:metallophosphoesterase [Candidatus Marsarchaeota archaeon]MCL5111737.1 metallophosphoesterase [Candidatus Marsarchaeota archaeon]